MLLLRVADRACAPELRLEEALELAEVELAPRCVETGVTSTREARRTDEKQTIVELGCDAREVRLTAYDDRGPRSRTLDAAVVDAALWMRVLAIAVAELAHAPADADLDAPNESHDPSSALALTTVRLPSPARPGVGKGAFEAQRTDDGDETGLAVSWELAAEARVFLQPAGPMFGPRLGFALSWVELGLLALFGRADNSLGSVIQGVTAANLGLRLWTRARRPRLSFSVLGELGLAWAHARPDEATTAQARRRTSFAAGRAALGLWEGRVADRFTGFVSLGLGYARGLATYVDDRRIATTHGPFVAIDLGMSIPPRRN